MYHKLEIKLNIIMKYLIR